MQPAARYTMDSVWLCADDNRTDRLRAILRRCNERPDGFGARIKGKAGRASASSACRCAGTVRTRNRKHRQRAVDSAWGIVRSVERIGPRSLDDFALSQRNAKGPGDSLVT